MQDKLTAKQEAFVREFLVDLNATQSAIRAGYAPKDANVQGPRLLEHRGVQASIAEAQREKIERNKLTQDEVISELRAIAHARLPEFLEKDGTGYTLKDLNTLSDEQKSAIAELSPVFSKNGELRYRIKLHDKQGALVSLGRHLGMFTDNLNVGIPAAQKLKDLLAQADEEPLPEIPPEGQGRNGFDLNDSAAGRAAVLGTD